MNAGYGEWLSRRARAPAEQQGGCEVGYNVQAKYGVVAVAGRWDGLAVALVSNNEAPGCHSTG